MTDILTELLHEADREYPSRLSRLCGQAAAEIERLHQHASEFHADICAENNNMKAEIERLRAALEDARYYAAVCPVPDELTDDARIEMLKCRMRIAYEQENLGVDAKGNPHPF